MQCVEGMPEQATDQLVISQPATATVVNSLECVVGIPEEATVQPVISESTTNMPANVLPTVTGDFVPSKIFNNFFILLSI